MKKPTHVEKLADAIDGAEQAMDPEKTEGPESAADTEVKSPNPSQYTSAVC